MTYFMEPMKVKKPSTHRVYMHYMHRHGYHISFMEPDLKTPLKRTLTFATSDKIFEMQERWGEDKSEEHLSNLKIEMGMGRPGGIWLILSAEQYAKLKG